MVNVKFDGKKEAERMAEFLEESERVLAKTLTIFQCDGRDEESTYVRLKREMGERLGVLVDVVFVEDVDDLETKLEAANSDEMVDGILVQLPIFDMDKNEAQEVLDLINPKKDVDGLSQGSRFVPAVVRAVERVIDVFKIEDDQKIAIVGSEGTVGKRLGERLKVLGFDYTGFDRGDNLEKLVEFDVVISATGESNLISEKMVKDGFIGIDLGYPKAEFSSGAIDRAMLITPVPGGIGPITVVSLYENLAEV